MTPARDNKAHEISVKVIEYPAGVTGDIADLLNTPNGPVLFGQMIRNARPGMSWMIDHVDTARRRDLDTLEGKVAATEDLVDMLLRQHPVAREQYIRQTAAKIGCSEDAIRQSLVETLRLRQAYYDEHPRERPWRHDDPDGDIGMDIPT